MVVQGKTGLMILGLCLGLSVSVSAMEASPREGGFFVHKLNLTKDQAEKIRVIKEKSEKEIEAVLTSEQRKQFAEFKKERAKHRAHFVQGMMLKKLDEKLVLSTDQEEKVGHILAQFQDELKGSDHKKGSMKQIREKRDERIESVLTDAQKLKFKELQKEMESKRSEWKKHRNK